MTDEEFKSIVCFAKIILEEDSKDQDESLVDLIDEIKNLLDTVQ